MSELEKREWCYAQQPVKYDVSCDNCGGDNTTWSEYKRYIWCYDCEIDTKGSGGIFDGPIPMEACRLMGIRFDKVRLSDSAVLEQYIENGEVKWREAPDE